MKKSIFDAIVTQWTKPITNPSCLQGKSTI